MKKGHWEKYYEIFKKGKRKERKKNKRGGGLVEKRLFLSHK
jgi:hypothetical protein